MALLALRIPSAFLALPTVLPSFEQVCARAPTPHSLEDLSAAVGCDPELLRRVSHRRQPLPAQLVAPLARLLGLQEGEVAAAARQVADPRVRLGARSLAALPADRLLGEPLYLRPVRSTRAPAFGA